MARSPPRSSILHIHQPRVDLRKGVPEVRCGCAAMSDPKEALPEEVTITNPREEGWRADGPARIYLQAWMGEVSWCEEPIGCPDGFDNSEEVDTPYVREDIAAAAIAHAERAGAKLPDELVCPPEVDEDLEAELLKRATLGFMTSRDRRAMQLGASIALAGAKDTDVERQLERLMGAVQRVLQRGPHDAWSHRWLREAFEAIDAARSSGGG